ncbi:DUF262 domain-containing protein [Streptomyces sp. NPDC005263]|uniref:GmrSD restriction endonuclease domain-containing protein n=1 Tax=Streptomyces sp. NPDC005263 TaxID=3364711 RepID=UPI0036BA6220
MRWGQVQLSGAELGLQGGVSAIDYYQRGYTWGEDEVRTLLRDLCGSFRNWSANPFYLRRPHTAPQYFLGMFVYYEPVKNRGYLVDGQQRFVTLLLLFLQLRLAAQERADTIRSTAAICGHAVSRSNPWTGWSWSGSGRPAPITATGCSRR